MSGDNGLVTSLLLGAAVIGTGGAALAAAPAVAGAMGGIGAFATANAGLLATVGALGSAGGMVMQGFQQKEALELERQQILAQNEREKTQYAVEKADREARLSDILSTQTAVFGSRGLMLGTGGTQRAQEVSVGESNKEQAISNLNRKTNERQLLFKADQKKREGRSAVISGFTNAGRSLLSAGASGSFGAGGPAGGDNG